MVLIHADDGWRFGHWMRARDGTHLPRPAEIVCEHRFGTPNEAVTFFRTVLEGDDPEIGSG